MNIKFQNFKVDEVKQSSGIFSGDNSQVRWKNRKKVNEGFGTLIGSKNGSTDNHHVEKKQIRVADIHGKKNEK